MSTARTDATDVTAEAPESSEAPEWEGWVKRRDGSWLSDHGRTSRLDPMMPKVDVHKILHSR